MLRVSQSQTCVLEAKHGWTTPHSHLQGSQFGVASKGWLRLQACDSDELTPSTSKEQMSMILDEFDDEAQHDFLITAHATEYVSGRSHKYALKCSLPSGTWRRSHTRKPYETLTGDAVPEHRQDYTSKNGSRQKESIDTDRLGELTPSHLVHAPGATVMESSSQKLTLAETCSVFKGQPRIVTGLDHGRPDSSGESKQMERCITPLATKILERMRAQLTNAVETNNTILCSSGSAEYSNHDDKDSVIAESVSSGQLNSKRPRRGNFKGSIGEENSDGDDDDDDKRDHPQKKQNRETRRRLRCPFYMREPARYTRSACKGAGFADMAKLKDHLKRVHMQPPKSMDLQTEGRTCNATPELLDDRISADKMSRLNFNRVPYANARNSEERWKMLYQELFPIDSDIPSPYAEPGLGPNFQRRLRQVLEQKFQEHFREMFANEMPDPPNSDTERLMTVIKERLSQTIQASIQEFNFDMQTSGNALESYHVPTCHAASDVLGEMRSSTGLPFDPHYEKSHEGRNDQQTP